MVLNHACWNRYVFYEYNFFNIVFIPFRLHMLHRLKLNIIYKT